MKSKHLQNFRSLDQDAFKNVMRQLGFRFSAVYRREGNAFVLVLKSDDEFIWPPAVSGSPYYTSNGVQLWYSGWLGLEGRKKIDLSWLKIWPKSAHIYFPDQELESDQILLAVTNASGKRNRGGELDGILEAVTNRIRCIYRAQTLLENSIDSGVDAHIKAIGTDLQTMMDHELRTPLASVSGYMTFLKELDPQKDSQAWRQYWNVMEGETRQALEAIDRLSKTLDNTGKQENPETLDVGSEISLLVKKSQNRAREIIGEEAGQNIEIHLRQFFDKIQHVNVQKSAFIWAIWEVLKNAMAHSRSGQIEVSLYTSDRVLVIDIEDDGQGVIQGSEELIFLRFYQDLRSMPHRKGRRGLGLGLFLARRIAQRHLGQLNFIRQRNSSLFRFIWPLADELSYDGPVKSQTFKGA